MADDDSTRQEEARKRLETILYLGGDYIPGRQFWEQIASTFPDYLPEELPTDSTDAIVRKYKHRLDEVMYQWVVGEHVHTSTIRVERIYDDLDREDSKSHELLELQRQAGLAWGLMVSGNPFNISPDRWKRGRDQDRDR